MDKIIITGGKKLKGSVKVSGSKNSALPILFATLLTDDPVTISNVPSLADIDATVAFLNFIGKKTVKKGNTVTAYKSNKYKHIAPYDLVRKMRASVLIMGPLLARLGKVDVSLPGGCAIGARPIDIHLEAFGKLGANIEVENGYVKTSSQGRLKGANINFRFPSVGATENIMIAAVLARGKTKIINAAKEPEIKDLADFLNKMGAKVKGAGTKNITIEGVTKLHGTTHKVIADRIEAATYLIAAAITKGEVLLKDAAPKDLKAITAKLKKAGLKITETKNSISAKWVKNLKPQNARTAVYPGFPTDVQAQWMALMSLVKGKSKIEETVFENRFLHVAELRRLGANLTVDGKTVHITGVEKLSAAPVMVSDLRAGAALVLAALAANGKSTVSRIYHLDRGYELLEKKLRTLGANIKRQS
ncbi:UDP-N-acetylglucosamine 1-carboxyvinyltransferase [Endomicrobium proavitum]|uniref:UDP-N-acetylglucosamine 1-carboxyvinyltransferase n=1 Tax=Endomicrobium proavitum TaxID=1408281 RepID=A0A0G3WIC4_9BACT|nr:UDP-N-acetylglucosamine 1-carboxyvinyltransferase [Endomicrobium proavitum]AKL98043.1 UDP-N-acetylglucosamine 1-carboxyvinyltransferase [Endomicrobium proavitum]